MPIFKTEKSFPKVIWSFEKCFELLPILDPVCKTQNAISSNFSENSFENLSIKIRAKVASGLILKIGQLLFTKYGIRRITNLSKNKSSFVIELDYPINIEPSDSKFLEIRPSTADDIIEISKEPIAIMGSPYDQPNKINSLLKFTNRFLSDSKPKKTGSSGKKILFISTVNPLASQQGNQVYSKQFLEFFIREDFIIDLVLLGDLNKDLDVNVSDKINTFTFPYPALEENKDICEIRNF